MLGRFIWDPPIGDAKIHVLSIIHVLLVILLGYPMLSSAPFCYIPSLQSKHSLNVIVCQENKVLD
jgi:hypothetical protein